MARLAGFFSCAFFLALTGAASASFELALIYDNDNDQIIRYDPVNKVRLGSFGQGRLGAWGNSNGLALDPTDLNLVAALDIDGNVRWFNYNTGILVRSVATGDINEFGYQNFKILSNGNLLVTAQYNPNRLTRIFNGTTGALINTFADYTGSGYTLMDCVPVGDGTYYSLERSGGAGNYSFHLFRRNSTGGFLGALYNYDASSSADFQMEIEVSGNKVFTLGRTAESLRAFSISGSTLTKDNLNYSIYGGAFASGLSVGHGGSVHFTQYRSGVPGNEFYSYDRIAGYYTYFGGTMPYTQELGGMVLVTAPEPGTMAVLGLGALAILRRRKVRRS